MKDRYDKIKELKVLIIVMGILFAIRASFTDFDFGYYGKWNFWTNILRKASNESKLSDTILSFGQIAVPIINIALPVLLGLAIIIIVDLGFTKNDK